MVNEMENKSYDDIILTQDEIDGINKYKKTFGEEWVDRSIKYKKASKYLEENFNIDRASWKAGNCYYKGINTYVRKNFQPVRKEDFEALHIMDHGQENKREISEDNMTMTHYWACDSGD